MPHTRQGALPHSVQRLVVPDSRLAPTHHRHIAHKKDKELSIWLRTNQPTGVTSPRASRVSFSPYVASPSYGPLGTSEFRIRARALLGNPRWRYQCDVTQHPTSSDRCRFACGSLWCGSSQCTSRYPKPARNFDLHTRRSRTVGLLPVNQHLDQSSCSRGHREWFGDRRHADLRSRSVPRAVVAE